MAGRGTDIKLGEGVRELGGLCVLGSERHESRRIDNQLRGRAGRQGDPGMSRFYVSVQDDLMIRFGSERMEGLFQSLGDTAIESKTVTKSISSAQRRVEGVNYDSRKQLLEYDDVMRQQRETMYEQRNYILENEDVHSVIHDMFRRVISDTVAAYVDPESRSNEVDTEGLAKSLENMGVQNVSTDALKGKNAEAVVEECTEMAWNQYNEKIAPVRDQVIPREKAVALATFDRAWSNEIDTMDKLRSGIGLRGYAQNNPLQAYVQEGYELFQEMERTIAQEIVAFCMNIRVVSSAEQE
jgi:preprotein translocase subunit SecA